MPIIKVTNDFHNTEARVRAEVGQVLSRRQMERMRRKLCGVKGCFCSGPLGDRGPQTKQSLTFAYHTHDSFYVREK